MSVLELNGISYTWCCVQDRREGSQNDAETCPEIHLSEPPLTPLSLWGRLSARLYRLRCKTKVGLPATLQNMKGGACLRMRILILQRKGACVLRVG